MFPSCIVSIFLALALSASAQEAAPPEPAPITIEQLALTGFNGQRVSVTGSVHDVAIVDGKVRLLLHSKIHAVTAWLPLESDTMFDLLDATVTVTGAAQTGRSPDGDTRGRVLVASRQDLRIIKPGSADIFTRPLHTLAQLREPLSVQGERFRVIGLVTCVSPAGWFYFQDDTGTGRGALDHAPPVTSDRRRFVQPSPDLQPGDVVELVGQRYNRPDEIAPMMPWFTACEWRIIGKRPVPRFEPVNAATVMTQDFDGRPVSLRGEVMEISVQTDFANFINHTLTVDDNGTRFTALLQRKTAMELPVHVGDYVQTDGVVYARHSPRGVTTGFRVSLNGPGDVRLAPRAVHVDVKRWLIGSGVCALLAGTWIFALRVQVRRQTARLREANLALERFKAVADSTSDMVGMASLDLQPLYINPAGRVMLGISPDEDITRMAFDSVYTPAAMERIQREGFPSGTMGGPWECELEMLHRDGRPLPVSFVGLVIKTPDGTPIHLACIARDLSTRLKIERQLRETLDSERDLLALKSTFVNTISHEFRTPLGIILFAASMLRRFDARFGLAERMEQVAAIEGAVARMNDLVEQSLSLGRAEAANPERRSFDVVALCHRIADEVMSATAHRSVVTFEKDDASFAQADSDETMLHAILVNLLVNAVKYSPARSPVILRLTRTGCDANFTVRDHGPGLREEDIPKLFTTFHRGADTAGIPGTGLGLAIVKRYAEALGGSVAARNAEGGGAEFTIALPRFFPSP